MSQELLIKKIEEQAATAVSEINTKAAADVSVIETAVKAELTQIRSAHEVDLKKQQEHLELVAVSKAKQAGNIAVQSAKRAGIEAVLHDTKKALIEMPSEEYIAFYGAQAKAALDEGADVTSVFCPKGREADTKKIMKELHDKAVVAVVAEDASIESGLVMLTKDGSYDVTLERLFTEKRPDLEALIVSSLHA